MSRRPQLVGTTALSRNGQLTVPIELWQRLGITRVVLEVRGDELHGTVALSSRATRQRQ